MQNLGEQCQSGHCGGGEKRSPCRLSQPPERVSENRHNEARGELGLVSGGRGEQNRLSRSVQKRVRIALGQQLTRTLADFGADEDELGVQLPRLQVPIRGRLVLVDRSSLEPNDWRPLGDGT